MTVPKRGNPMSQQIWTEWVYGFPSYNSDAERGWDEVGLISKCGGVLHSRGKEKEKNEKKNKIKTTQKNLTDLGIEYRMPGCANWTQFTTIRAGVCRVSQRWMRGKGSILPGRRDVSSSCLGLKSPPIRPLQPDQLLKTGALGWHHIPDLLALPPSTWKIS